MDPCQFAALGVGTWGSGDETDACAVWVCTSQNHCMLYLKRCLLYPLEVPWDGNGIAFSCLESLLVPQWHKFQTQITSHA